MNKKCGPLGQLAISEQNEQLITKNFLVDFADFYFSLSMEEIVLFFPESW